MPSVALNCPVSTVAEIESALQKLPVDDAWKVADWLQEYLDAKWDKQIDADISTGKLDKLADEALEDYHAGRVKPLDEIINQPWILAGLRFPSAGCPRRRAQESQQKQTKKSDVVSRQ